MRDEEIIDLYFRRDEKAIKETDQKYGRYCQTIATNILMDELDTEECINDTYMKAWNKIPPTKPAILKAFLAKITRDIALNMFKATRTAKRGGGTITELLDELEDCIPDNNSVEQSILSKELAGIIRCFVRDLDEKDAYLFTSRYFYAEDIVSLAGRFGMTRHNVTVTLSRLRKKLQVRLVKEGYLAS